MGTVTVSVLLSWKPSQLATISDQLNVDRKGLVDLQDELDTGAPPDGWIGLDHYSADLRHTRLYDDLVDYVAEVARVIGALDSAAESISSAKGSLESAITSAERSGFSVNREDGTISDTEPVDASDIGAEVARMKVRNNYVQLINSALQTAADADADLAAALRAANSGTIDVSGSLEDQSVMADLRGKTPEEQAKYLLDRPELGRSLLDTLPTEVRQQIGEQLAALDLTPEWPDEISAADLERLNDQFDAYGEDPVVATSFANRLGPDGLLKLNANRAGLGYDTEDDGNPYRPPVSDEMARQMANLQTNLGQSLDAATEGLDTPGNEDGTSRNVSQDWIDTLLKQGRELYNVDYTPLNEQNHQVHGFQLLAPLLRSVDNHHLLNEVGDEMLRFETDFAKDNGGHLPWNIRYINDEVTGVGRNDAHGLTDGLRLDWTQGHDDDDPAGFDPMGALMHGLSNNPDAARDFLTGDPVDVGFRTGDDGRDTEMRETSRLDYLMTDRHWNDDRTDLRENMYIDPRETRGPNGLDDLGRALHAATTDDPTSPGAQRQVRELLEETVRSIANDEQRSGHDNRLLDDKQTKEFHETDWIHPELRDDVAAILSHHMDSVYGTLDTDPSTDVSDTGAWVPHPEGTSGVRWDLEELRTVLKDLGKDADAQGALSESGTEHAASQLATDPENTAHTQNVAKTLGDLFTTVGEGRDAVIADEWKSKDQDYNDDIDRKAAVADFLIGQLPTGKNPLTGAALDLATGALIESWQESNHVDRDGDLDRLLSGNENQRELYALQVIAAELDRLEQERSR